MKLASENMRFAIYSRKSVYTKEGDSVDNQIIECKRTILAQHPDTTDDDIAIYSDEGYSGKNTERPEYQKMLEAIRNEQIHCVVCYRLDRLSRSVGDFSNLLEELKCYNVTFISINERFDTSTPMGMAMIRIAAVFAQLERETIAERVRDNMYALARKGQWLGGTPPLGYKSERVERVTVDGKSKTVCNLEVNPDEIETVRIIFDKFLELRSLNGVSKYLIKQGKESRKGAMFSLLGLKEILQNPVYCTADGQALTYFTEHQADVCFGKADYSDNGLLAYNKRDHSRKNIPRNTIDKWIIAVGKHKSVISGEDWVKVQKILEGNKTTRQTTDIIHNDYALLSGMIRCDKCGARMFAKQRNGDNPNLFYYVCSNKLRGSKAKCDCENIGGPEADDIVCEYLTRELDNGSDIYRYLDKLKKDVAPQKQENPLDAIDKKITKCESDMKNLLQALKLGASEALVKQINEESATLERELESLKAQRTEIEKEADIISDKELQVDLITEALADLKANFATLTIHDKRNIIKVLVKEIVWDGENFNIFIYGE